MLAETIVQECILEQLAGPILEDLTNLMIDLEVVHQLISKGLPAIQEATVHHPQIGAVLQGQLLLEPVGVPEVLDQPQGVQVAADQPQEVEAVVINRR